MTVTDELRHRPVTDRAGTRIGTLEQVLCEVDSGRARWVVLASGPFGMARSLAPAGGLRSEHSSDGPIVVLEVDADLVTEAPLVDPWDGLSAAEDRLLRRHYGLTCDDPPAGTPGRAAPRAHISGG